MSAGSGAAALGGGVTGVPWPGWVSAVARDAVGVADDRDQELLVLAHREIGPEPVPRGERGHRDAVEAGDRVGGLARLDAVADRVDQRLGLAALERIVGRSRGHGGARGPAERLGADGAGVETGRRPGHAVGQQQHLARPQHVVVGQRVAPGELVRGRPDPARHRRHRVAVAGHRDLVGRVGDDAARVGREVRQRLRRRLGRRIIAGERVLKAAAGREPQGGGEQERGCRHGHPCSAGLTHRSPPSILWCCVNPIRPAPPLRQGERSGRRRGRCSRAPSRS